MSEPSKPSPVIESLLKPLSPEDAFQRRWGKPYMRTEVMEAGDNLLYKFNHDNPPGLVRRKEHGNDTYEEFDTEINAFRRRNELERAIGRQVRVTMSPPSRPGANDQRTVIWGPY